MKKKLLFFISYIVGFVLLCTLLYFLNLTSVAESLVNISPVWILASVVVYGLDWILRSVKWQIILENLGCKMKFRDNIRLNLAGNFMNLIIPAKMGDLSKVYAAKKKYGMPYKKGLISVGSDRFFDLVSVLFLALLSLIPLSFSLKLDFWLISLILSALVVTILGFVAIIFSSKLEALFSRWKRVSEVLSFLGDSINPKSLAIIMTVASVIWIMEASITFFVMTSLNISAPIWIVIFAVMIGNLTKTIPITPGGVGVYELTVTTVLMFSGMSYEVGFSIAVLDHLLKNIFLFAAGLFSVSHMGFSFFKLDNKE